MPHTYRPTTAIQLLTKVVAIGRFKYDELAAELGVSIPMLNAYLAGKQSMPEERQLLLAVLVIEELPQLARSGHRLRGQASATIAFKAHETTVHLGAHVSRFK